MLGKSKLTIVIGLAKHLKAQGKVSPECQDSFGEHLNTIWPCPPGQLSLQLLFVQLGGRQVQPEMKMIHVASCLLNVTGIEERTLTMSSSLSQQYSGHIGTVPGSDGHHLVFG